MNQRHWTKATRAFALCGAAFVAFLFGSPRWAFSQEPPEIDFEDLEPKLIVTFSDDSGQPYRRLDEEPNLTQADLDLRLRPGHVKIRWTGYLHIQLAGEHKFYGFGWNKIRLKISDQLVVDGIGPCESKPATLPLGFHRVELIAEGAVRPKDSFDGPLVQLLWSGPGFGIEPLPSRLLYHDAGEKIDDRFQQGRLLAKALHCSNCHDLPLLGQSQPAPALDRAGGQLHADWTAHWLDDEMVENELGAAQRRMPHFKLDHDEAKLLAEYLCRPATTQQDTSTSKKRDPQNVEAGRLLTLQLGCLACHSVGEHGTKSIHGGGDLTRIADKRPAGFFARWLKDPTELNRHHRMPVFDLTDREIQQIATYLQSLTLTADAKKPSRAQSNRSLDVARARKQIAAHRCNACHTMRDEKSQTVEKIKLTRSISPAPGCLSDTPPRADHPTYSLTKDQRGALSVFVETAMQATDTLAASSARPRDFLTENNCLACHARGMNKGLGDGLAALAEAEPKLRDTLGALAPPSLDAVGAKLHTGALRQAIARKGKPHRDWLAVRMPRFDLSDEDLDALVRYFAQRDQPTSHFQQPEPVEVSTSDARLVGSRLVTAEGFGCTSCHQIGKWKPDKVALNARGPDLLGLEQRVRRDWFDRWVRNPARIIPRMEMPAVQQPVRGVLGEDLNQQLAAVWSVLNIPDFQPPPPGALRVVRCMNLPDSAERAQLVTDVVEQSGRTFVRPLVIGLPNRHNVLFDVARGELSAWWLGDTARQRTRGKSWYWEAGGEPLFSSREPGSAELARVSNTGAAGLESALSFALDSIAHVEGGIEWNGQFRFGKKVFAVRQRFDAPPKATGNAYRRTVSITGAPPRDQFRLRLVPQGAAPIEVSGRSARFDSPLGNWSVTSATDKLHLELVDNQLCVLLQVDAQGNAECRIDYQIDRQSDQVVTNTRFDRSVKQQTLDVVPGFDAVRLPVTDEAMPTGLAWTNDGQLLLCSLEGRVWRAVDRDGDGIEDELLPISDTYPAPYGIATAGDAIDLLCKYGLVRLHDENRDGFFERAQLIADGWGYSTDYHDWAVGLPRDRDGNYFVGLPCQQDDRSQAEAKLRGTIVRLAPRTPSNDDPRLFRIEPIASGLRFPMGLALSRDGDLFASDNQGNYTPFNELNHIQQGQRYGFVNKLDAQQGVKSEPHARAAIEIPHPWTRSVNGICFLLQGGSDATNAKKPFGPWTGHLLGCEYDTRRLVRMSLEKIDGVYQGAVYPASREPREGQPTFEGPLVCQVSPAGEIYVGNIRDSGWGAGSNTGSLVRLKSKGDLPPGIAEVQARSRGFRMLFTQRIDSRRGQNPANYSISSYKRTPTPAYGGPDEDRRNEKITRVTVSADGMAVEIELSEMRPGYVYEFQLRPLNKGEFFPDEAYYTLRQVPK